MDVLLEQTATRILSDFADAPDALWRALEENGLTRLWAGEADGGFDMAPEEGFGLIWLAGAHAAAVPLADTLAAAWLLSEAGLPVPSGRMGIFIDGWQRGVAFGDVVEHVVCIRDRSVSLHRGPWQGCALTSIGKDALISVPRLRDAPVAEGEMQADGGLAFAALARAAQICGAIEAVLAMTIAFAGQREQFGRPLSKNQAIQHLLSEMGAEAAAATGIVDAAILSVRRGAAPDLTTTAAAKYRAGVAAGIVAEHAHQVHGAIGYTDEYGLARLTRRLWRWREDFGGESFWANMLGQAALAGPGRLWPRIADGGLG
ncbi:acyl-CoA dehydrogenase family protein [Rhizorhabdus dicambivorans]|uniref:Acyl-CoA dehydrogenase/oxidase C-terminal domain-containing protein n=1 Tax=Rhizorhabdus dicambivorans TaxID=1850238 RepID=A0A2A4FSI4_9SPHN|nr:acyl-CoA dehydrogenase family protein [Rhizorhabdus dicambivorans]ATE66397.1 hypothetical protein CMV14_19960 [Rhizorhabdus dicambivorans]PCE40361.1 hypothetical protein COO09_20485 [Rhizorhabdus dicambivorans]